VGILAIAVSGPRWLSRLRQFSQAIPPPKLETPFFIVITGTGS